jgi:hypothetical protein
MHKKKAFILKALHYKDNVLKVKDAPWDAVPKPVARCVLLPQKYKNICRKQIFLEILSNISYARFSNDWYSMVFVKFPKAVGF